MKIYAIKISLAAAFCLLCARAHASDQRRLGYNDETKDEERASGRNEGRLSNDEELQDYYRSMTPDQWWGAVQEWERNQHFLLILEEQSQLSHSQAMQIAIQAQGEKNRREGQERIRQLIDIHAMHPDWSPAQAHTHLREEQSREALFDIHRTRMNPDQASEQSRHRERIVFRLQAAHPDWSWNQIHMHLQEEEWEEQRRNELSPTMQAVLGHRTMSDFASTINSGPSLYEVIFIGPIAAFYILSQRARGRSWEVSWNSFFAPPGQQRP